MPRKGKFATQVTRCSNFVASVGWDNVQIAQKRALELTLDHLKFDIFSEILLSLAIKVPRPLYNFPQSLFFVLLWLRVAFIQNNVFWLHHFGTKAILSFWAAQTISSSLVVSASIAVIVLSVVVFSISVPPMVLISEELINSCLGKSIFCPSGSFCGLNVSRRRLRVVCWIENTGVLNSKVLVELDAPICVLQLPLSFVLNARDNLFTHKHDAQRAKAISAPEALVKVKMLHVRTAAN